MAEDNSTVLSAGIVETDAAVKRPETKRRLLSSLSQPHHKR
ncbi:hypothetical protein ABIA20_001004 [Sinorhizobium fredii]